ncbi:uncharacterized protein LOC134563425 [Prinia subflava]|uniref:uncharacterized protein LOC134563425 n=1 Tax=Prinia subflava TaxID=208062 RepID=UPI002FE0135A
MAVVGFLNKETEICVSSGSQFLQCDCNCGSRNGMEKESYLKELLKELPDAHYCLLKYLCQFLIKVAEHRIDNSMNLCNLATVFGLNGFQGWVSEELLPLSCPLVGMHLPGLASECALSRCLGWLGATPSGSLEAPRQSVWRPPCGATDGPPPPTDGVSGARTRSRPPEKNSWPSRSLGVSCLFRGRAPRGREGSALYCTHTRQRNPRRPAFRTRAGFGHPQPSVRPSTHSPEYATSLSSEGPVPRAAESPCSCSTYYSREDRACGRASQPTNSGTKLPSSARKLFPLQGRGTFRARVSKEAEREEERYTTGNATAFLQRTKKLKGEHRSTRREDPNRVDHRGGDVFGGRWTDTNIPDWTLLNPARDSAEPVLTTSSLFKPYRLHLTRSLHLRDRDWHQVTLNPKELKDWPLAKEGFEPQEDKIQKMPPWKYLGLEIGKRTIVPQKVDIRTDVRTLADAHQLCGALN